MNIKEGSDNDRENKDEEHTEFKGFRQFPHFLKERSDDGKRCNSKNNYQFIESSGDEKSQSCSDSEEEHTKTKTDKHTAYVLFSKHPAVVLYIFRFHIFVRTTFARYIIIGQNLTEYFVSSADDEEDIRCSKHHFKCEDNSH